MSLVALPSLRRKIFRSFLALVFLYGVLGAFLMLGVVISSGTSPRLIHLNYDSIQAAMKMRESWSALQNLENYPESISKKTLTDWIGEFEQALRDEEGNITEPGEKEIVASIRKLWDNYRQSQAKAGSKISVTEFDEMLLNLSQLVSVNEKGMFGLAQQNDQLSHRVLLAAFCYFLISLILSLILADGLASRLSSPIKGIAEVLRGSTGFGRRLKLAPPQSLELLILNTELTRLWERVSEADKVNVSEILRQKTKLETVLESVEDALLVVDENGKVTQCNECMLHLLGLTESQVKGFSWRDLPSVSDSYLRLRSLLNHEMPHSQEVELTLAGNKRQFSARSRDIRAALPQVSGGGDSFSRLYLLHDITEKKQREKFRSEFVDLLSHELKTPLQSLGTASELLISQRDTLPETVRLMVDTIAEDTERIRAVANEFVQVTQSQNKALRLKLDILPLNNKLQEWLRPFHVVAKDRKVKLRYEQEGSEVIWANVDSVKFPWVISNLASNAIRFSPPESEVVIMISDRNGAIEIQVRDNGPGISEDDQRRMFDPFFQGIQSPMTTGMGNKGLFGIGLTIAKEVVEAHDGRIEYYPLKPHGSEFRIVLPFPPADYNR